MQGLAQKLEVKLFKRLGNKVRLTEAGERLLQCAEEILAKVGKQKELGKLKGLKGDR